DLVGVLIMRNALAVIAADAGRIEAAYEHVARAIEIARVSGPAAYLAHCYATRAEVALKARDVPLARSSAEAAIYKSLDAKAELGDVLMRLSRSAKKHGDLRAAERYATQAYTVTKLASANVEV